MAFAPSTIAALRPLHYFIAVGIVSVTVGIAFLLDRLMPHANLSLLFLTGVLIVAARTGVGPSLVASVLSFLAYNFFFTQPYYTLKVAHESDIANLVFFLVIAAITGNLAARMQQEIAKRRTSLQRISKLYEFSRRLSSAAGTEAVVDALADHVAQSMNRTVGVLLPDAHGDPKLTAVKGSPRDLPPGELAAAWTMPSSEPIGMGPWTFLKLTASGKRIGMLAIADDMDAEQMDSLRSLYDQAGMALDRTQLVADLEQARLISETEQLRSALLSSVSHDLRTPLASIIGSTTSLLEYGKSFSDANRKELLMTVVEEAQRLDRHIQNLLDMTRLGQGNLSLKREWVDVHDIVSSAVDRLRSVLKGLRIEITIAPTVPLLWVHGVLLEQALVNLLDNAVSFSPADGCINLSVGVDANNVVLELCDEGPGIPENEREKIFDMFYTIRQGDRGNLKGTGLGLAICRGMVAAHKGTVTAHDGRGGRGSCMRIRLPIIQPNAVTKS